MRLTLLSASTWHILVLLFLVPLLAACQGNENAYRQPTDLPTYPAPEDQSELLTWNTEQHTHWRILAPGDPYSPRALYADTGPDFDVYSFDGVLQDVQKDVDVDFKFTPDFEKLEAWTAFDGSDTRVLLAPTNFAGTDGVFFMLVSKKQDSDTYGIIALETTESTFRDWGGIARMLVLRDVIPSLEVIPAEERARLAGVPLDRQLPFYEAALDALFEGLSAQAMMMTQGQVLQTMQQLNYDMLLGKDFSTPVVPD